MMDDVNIATQMCLKVFDRMTDLQRDGYAN